MKLAFKADSPALLQIAEIGEFLAETNDLLRRNIVFSVLAAVRDGEIPLRNKAGLKVPSDVLRDTKRKARLVAKQKAESRARMPCRLDIDIACLLARRQQYLESEGPVLSITHGVRLPEYDEKIFNLTREKQLLVEWEREQRDLDKAIQLNNSNRRRYVWLSDLAGWLRDDQGFDVTIGSPDRATSYRERTLADDAGARLGATKLARVPKKASAKAKKQAKLRKIICALESYAKGAKLEFDREDMPGPLGGNWNEEGSFHWFCAKLCRDFKRAKTTFESYRAGICAVRKYAKPGDFYSKALPYIAPTFGDAKKAGQEAQKHINQ